MLLELNYYQPAKQDKFPNCLLSQHLHTASLLLPCEALPVVVFTLRCLTGLESGLMQNHGVAEPHWEKSAAVTTYEAKQTV